MTNELLKKLQDIVQKQDMDLFIEVLENEDNEKEVQLYFNSLCNLIESFNQYEKIRESTLKILENKNDITKDKEITLSELKAIASDFRNNINFARGYELRRDPKYNKAIADDIAKTIQEEGLINYWNEHISKLHLGEHRNIYRKVLGAFNVMRGKASYLFETTASSGAGKSLEDEIAFLTIIPPQYIFRKSSITYAGFTRYGHITPYYFDRMLIYFGDFGSKKSFSKIEDVFDVFKELITENEYSRVLTEKDDKGNHEIDTIDLKVTSIGAVYSTVHTDFTDADNQLISRTLKSTVYPVNEDKLLEFIGYLNYSKSPQSIARDNAIKELKRFQHYLLSLVNTDIEIINPFISVFMDYAKESEVISREYEQILTLFDAYCLLTNYDCQAVFLDKGYYVASPKQVRDFFNYIALENALIPVQSNFLKMIIAKDKPKFALTIIKEEHAEDLEDAKNSDSVSPLNIYLNTAVEDTTETLYKFQDKIINSIEDLDSKSQEMVINRLMKYYRLAGQSTEHKENVFFTVNDIARNYRKLKAYRDVDNASKLLSNLNKKGYLDKLEYKYKGSNIYYLTGKCENITKSVEIKMDVLKKQNEFLSKIGLYNELEL